MRWSSIHILAIVGCDSVVDFGSEGSEPEDRRVADTGPAAPPATTPTGDTAAPVNTPPTMLPPFSFTVDQGTTLSDQLRARDDDGDPLVFTLVAAPTSGTLTLDRATGSFSYVPLPSFSGTDGFDVEVDDGVDRSAPTAISLLVVPSGGFVVSTQTFMTDEDVPVSDTITTTPPGGALSFRIGDPPRSGIVALATTTGDFTYTPDVDFNGVDDFTVVANDGLMDSLPARITILVGPINDAPVIVPNPFTALSDRPTAYVVDASDVEGDPLTFVLDTPPSQGTATISAVTGVVTYAPTKGYTGPDSMIVEVADGVLSTTAAIPIMVVADSDGDTVPDSVDVCPGFDDRLDMDGDTVPDDCDQCDGHDDAVDSDSDGVPDGCDACPGFDDADDADGDGIPDGCEP